MRCLSTGLAFSAILVLGPSLPPLSAAQEPPASPTPQEFPARVELINVEVTVVDKQGQPVSGLRQGDFDVFENGVQQEIATFEAVDLRDQVTTTPPATEGEPTAVTPPAARSTSPRWTYVILIDDLHLTLPRTSDVKKAVLKFLATVPSGSRVALIATGARIVEDRLMPQGRELLTKRLASVRGTTYVGHVDELISDQEAYDIHVRRDPAVEEVVAQRILRLEQIDDRIDPFEKNAVRRTVGLNVRARAATRYYEMSGRTKTTLSVLYNTLRWLEGIPGRKMVILASMGFIRDPLVGETEHVLRASLRANVAIHFLDVRTLGGFSPFEAAEYGPALDTADLIQTVSESFSEAAGAESMALDSGGTVIHYANNLAKGIGKIAELSRVYYLLGFQSSNPARDGKYRKLSVKLRSGGKDLTLRGRLGYFAPKE